MRAGLLTRGCVGLSLQAVVLGAALTATTGCKVQVNKTGDGGGANVKIATPFGDIAVNKDQASLADLGLAAYPGAIMDTGEDGNKTAKVDLGFGSWKLRVKVAHYSTADSRDQVLDFYRKALGEYGGAIECVGNKPVGTPVKTVEGLSCADSDYDHTDHNNSAHSGDLQLKAGSPRHQHLVVLKAGNGATTQFTLIALDLPRGPQNGQQGTN